MWFQSQEEKALEKRARKEERKEEKQKAKREKEEDMDHLSRLKQQGYDPEILRKERYMLILYMYMQSLCLCTCTLYSNFEYLNNNKVINVLCTVHVSSVHCYRERALDEEKRKPMFRPQREGGERNVSYPNVYDSMATIKLTPAFLAGKPVGPFSSPSLPPSLSHTLFTVFFSSSFSPSPSIRLVFLLRLKRKIMNTLKK